MSGRWRSSCWTAATPARPSCWSTRSVPAPEPVLLEGGFLPVQQRAGRLQPDLAWVCEEVAFGHAGGACSGLEEAAAHAVEGVRRRPADLPVGDVVRRDLGLAFCEDACLRQGEAV